VALVVEQLILNLTGPGSLPAGQLCTKNTYFLMILL